MNLLCEFTEVHKYDDNDTFNEAWSRWCFRNGEQIEKENKRLKSLGCKKEIYEKMYKTVRYYLKKKSNVKSKPKERRNYVTIDKMYIEEIDRHIETCLRNEINKPQECYEKFVNNEEKKDILDSLKKEIMERGLNEDEYIKKLKKTYKNRLFIMKKK
jgi:hypothetical protein